MPIYAYRCERCGHAQDVIQKFSDAPLTTCPSCGADAYRKQLTAPAFQLKGSGWYVTDFRDNGKKSGAKTGADAGGDGADAKPADAKPADAKPAEAAPAKAADAPAAASPAATPPKTAA